MCGQPHYCPISPVSRIVYRGDWDALSWHKARRSPSLSLSSCINVPMFTITYIFLASEYKIENEKYNYIFCSTHTQSGLWILILFEHKSIQIMYDVKVYEYFGTYLITLEFEKYSSASPALRRVVRMCRYFHLVCIFRIHTNHHHIIYRTFLETQDLRTHIYIFTQREARS